MSPVFAALTTSETLDLAIAIITGVAVIIAAVAAWIGTANERKRTQPVVMANEARGRYMSDSAAMHGAWFVDAYLTSEGSGPAFNVRFGVEFHRVRIHIVFTAMIPTAGTYNGSWVPATVVLRRAHGRFCSRRPASSVWLREAATPILGASTGHGTRTLRATRGRRAILATAPAKLDIRRVRVVARRERRMREASAAYSAEFEKKALAELIAGLDEPTSDGPTNGRDRAC
jgi:hypothetical protein